MGWRLYFFRRVGEPYLTLEEVDRYFMGRPGYERDPALLENPEVEGVTHFRLADASTGLTLNFSFDPLPVDEEESQGRADFPYEDTPLELDMDYCQPAEAVDLALREVDAVAAALGVLVQDPQLGPEVPCRPDRAALERSYAHYSQDVAQTIAYLRSRRRNLLAIGGALLLAGLLLLLLSALGAGR